jgi:hypothetical protein
VRRAYVPFPAIPRIICSTPERERLQAQMNSLMFFKIEVCNAFYEISHVERSAQATGGPQTLYQVLWHEKLMKATRNLKRAGDLFENYQEGFIAGRNLLSIRPDWVDEQLDQQWDRQTKRRSSRTR